MAQLVEQRPYKAKVGSSSLSGSTTIAAPPYDAASSPRCGLRATAASASASRAPITA